MALIIGILKEKDGENRVSALPDVTSNLIKLQAEVWIENGAGNTAFESDNQYIKAGAVIRPRNEILSTADIILCIHPLADAEIAELKGGAIIIGVYQPLFNFEMIHDWSSQNVTTFSLDMLPRTTRAQSMDVLSSQANIAGYKAVLLAAGTYPKYFPMMMTAAGSVAPAKFLILGAGVAGLQAIATAKRLGAVIEVFDTRAASKEEVMSLGAKFIEVEGAADASKAGGYAVEQTEAYKQKQTERIHDAIVKADIVITTAQIPGKRAPLLITKEMVHGMKPGSVIVDLAASTGGNCEYTRNNDTVMHNGVTIIGNSNLPSSMPSDASKLYGKNVFNFLKLLISAEGKIVVDFEDNLVKGACMTHQGKVVNEKINEMALVARN